MSHVIVVSAARGFVIGATLASPTPGTPAPVDCTQRPTGANTKNHKEE